MWKYFAAYWDVAFANLVMGLLRQSFCRNLFWAYEDGTFNGISCKLFESRYLRKTFRSNRQELKSFIRIFEKHLRRSWFFLQLQARNLQLWKKRGNSQVFLVAPFAGSFTRLPLSSSFLPPKLLWNRLIPPPLKKNIYPLLYALCLTHPLILKCFQNFLSFVNVIDSNKNKVT